MAASIRLGRGFIEIDADTDKATRAVNTFVKNSNKAFAGAAAVIASSGAGIAAALGGVGAAFAGLGVLAASANGDVADSFTDLWGQIVSGAQSAAEPLTPVLTGIAKDFSDLNAEVQPQLREMFAASGPALQALSDGVIGFTRSVMPALSKSVQAQQPVFEAFGGLISDIGQGLSDFLTSVSSEAGSAARSIEAFGGIVRTALGFAGNLLAQLSAHGAPVLERLDALASQLSTSLLGLSNGALPVLASAVGGALDVLSGLLSIVGGNTETLGSLIAIVLTLTTSFRLLNTVTFGALGAQLASIGESIGKAEGASKKLRTGFGVLSSGFGVATVAAAGIGSALAILGDAQQRAAERAEAHADRVGSLSSALRDSNGAIDGNVRALAAKELQTFKTLDKERDLLALAREVGISQGDLVNAYLGNADAQARLNSQLNSMTPSLDEYNRLTSSGTEAERRRAGSLAILKDAVQQNNGLFGEAVRRNQELVSASEQAAAATRDHTAAIAEQMDQALAAASSDLAYRQSLVQLRDAQKQADEAVAAHGLSSQKAQDEILSLEQAMLRSITAAKEKAVSDNAGKSASDQAKAANAALSAEFQRLATSTSPAAQAALANIVRSMSGTQLAALGATAGVNDVGQAVAVLPGGKTVEIDAEVAEALRKAAEADRALNDAARQRTAFIDVVSRATRGPGIRANVPHAAGGSFYGQRPMLVGENGPEYIFPDRGGFVATARQTQDIQRGAVALSGSRANGVAVTQNITTLPHQSSDEIGRDVVNQLVWRLSR